MKTRDIISSLLIMALGAVFIIGGLQQGLIRRGVPGPGFVPFLTAMMLVAFGLMVLLPAIFQKRDGEKVEKFFPEHDSLKKVILALIALGLYGMLLNYAGFLITTFLFMTFACRLMEPVRWRTVLIVAVATAVICHLLFIVALDVPLPRGVLGI